MTINELDSAIVEKIRAIRYDSIVEKHEGPFTYEWELTEGTPRRAEMLKWRAESSWPYELAADADFLEVDGLFVLLPVSADQHPNIPILHHFVSKDDQKLVLYLKNTHYEEASHGTGFVAICDRFPNEHFYVATLYHEWFVIDYEDSV
ncbi:MAG: hypothetical protein AAGJ18_08065 [Bacteroidota bacterium]